MKRKKKEKKPAAEAKKKKKQNNICCTVMLLKIFLKKKINFKQKTICFFYNVKKVKNIQRNSRRNTIKVLFITNLQCLKKKKTLILNA